MAPSGLGRGRPRLASRWPWIALVVGVLLWSSPRAGAGEAPVPPPGPRDRCPVCGMFVAPYPNWTAAARFADGAVVYFDGPKDLFRFTHAVATYAPERAGQQIRSLWVTEYYTARLMPAAGLYFSVGSDVLGPMGHELVPIEGEESARTFAVDHRGRQLLTRDEVTPDVIDGLP